MKLRKQTKLASVIRNEYIRSIVYPLLIIELTLLIAYFWSNSYVNKATQSALIDEAKINIIEISRRSSSIVNSEFSSIADTAELMQSRHTEFFHSYTPDHYSPSHPHYRLTEDGVVVNTKSSADSCTLFYSNIHKQNANRLEKAIATEELDPFYNAILKTNENIAQVYFNSYDSMNRLCPYMEDALGQYPHDIDIPIYNFYYLADQKHNPDKKVVWTDAYLDPAGQGWMISAIAPVYHKEFLEGVIGIDITLEKILNNILSIKLPYTTYSLLVDKSGNILAMSHGLEPLIGIKELTSHHYDNPITETISKPKDFNILEKKNNPLIAKLADILKKNRAMDEFHQGTENLLITQNQIDQTGWTLVLLVDKNSLLANTDALKEKTDRIGYFILALMALFYLIFFLVIVQRSRQFSQTILQPIQNLVDATNELKTNLEMVKIEYSNINEIDILIDNFTSMGHDLRSLYDTMQSKIEEGIAKNKETQKMMIYQSRLAAMGEMISMIAHQWRQPVNTIALLANNLYFDLELNTLNEATVKNAVLKTLDLTQELSKTIDDFRNFFKPDKELVEADLNAMLDDAAAVIGKAIEYGNIALIRPENIEIRMMTYSRELVQVLINILKNAKDAFAEHTSNHSKVIKIEVEENPEGVVIQICDNAGGITEEIMERIFDPYFTTKEEMNGTGLGLYMSKIIIEKHLKGVLSAFNLDDGACFRIELPRLSADDLDVLS